MEFVLSGGVYPGKNTAHARRRAKSEGVRGRACVYMAPSSPQKSGCATFLTLKEGAEYSAPSAMKSLCCHLGGRLGRFPIQPAQPLHSARAAVIIAME